MPVVRIIVLNGDARLESGPVVCDKVFWVREAQHYCIRLGPHDGFHTCACGTQSESQ
jgi:hypothetical protein